ncbi:MAG TPA: stage V sporulation protein AC [Clostridiales bacterium]|jgi:stage V sporulation protein AC|nr:stage V sporulation protein AC [Clostridiales bacterium]
MSDQKKGSISDVLNEKDIQKRNEFYNQYVKEVTPKFSVFKNSVKAFLIGGIICTIGQFLTTYFKNLGQNEENAKSYTSLVLILLSILLTGFGIYQKLAKFGGAGTLVPITGFANSVAAPAVEYKKEGQVFGIGCKIFTIAGPVILYGIFSSWVLGLIYYLLKRFGLV